MRLALAAAVAVLSSSAFAQECWVTYDQLLDDIAQAHGTIVGSATYDGSATVQMIVVDINGQIVMFGIDARGCLFGQIIIEASKSGGESGGVGL